MKYAIIGLLIVIAMLLADISSKLSVEGLAIREYLIVIRNNTTK